MSKIDLNNPKVLRNFLRNQMEEGKGKFKVKEKVTVFEFGEGAGEMVVPEDVLEAFELKKEKKAEEAAKKTAKKTAKK